MGTRLELSSRDRTILFSIRCAGADPYMVLLIPTGSAGPDPRLASLVGGERRSRLRD